MTDRQQQEASGGSLAVQSGRDTTIYHGIAPDDMRRIIEATAAQLPAYAAMAAEIVEARLKNFEYHILQRFGDEKAARREAFGDPDFQYLLGRAQHFYARSGDPNIRDILVDLIGQRSRQKEQNQLALSLNEAIEKSARLTKNEFAELSLVYLVRDVIHRRLNSIEAFIEFLKKNYIPLLGDISRENASYTYLEAQGCASITPLQIKLIDQLRIHYGGLFSKGFTRDQLENHLPDGQKQALNMWVKPCLNDMDRLQFNTINRKAFVHTTNGSTVSESAIDNVWNMFENSMWTREELISNLSRLLPEIESLFSVWENTPLKQLRLTSVGTAIAHSNLVRVSGIDADLAIWIK